MLTPPSPRPPLPLFLSPHFPPRTPATRHRCSLVIAQGTLQPLLREVAGMHHLGDSHIMVWKALGLLHRVCQDVGEGILEECIEDVIKSINYLRRLCGDHETDLYSKASGLLAQVLLSKVETHKKIPALSGLWVSSRNAEGLYTDYKEVCGAGHGLAGFNFSAEPA